MAFYLSTDSHLVHDKSLESAVVKIISGDEVQLNSSEQSAVSSILISSSDGQHDASHENSPSLSYYERLQAKRRRLTSDSSGYVNFKFITATSASVERTFSAARWILTCLRKSMSPILFESILFLKLNRHLWDLKLVSSAMKMKASDRYKCDLELDSDEFYNTE